MIEVKEFLKKDNNKQVDISEFFDRESFKIISNLIKTIKKSKRRVATPKELAIELLKYQLKKHKDKTLDIVNAIEEIHRTKDIEDLEMKTNRYILLSPNLQIIILQAFLEAQDEGLTDVTPRHLLTSLTNSTVYNDIAKILKNILYILKNNYPETDILNQLEGEMKKRIVGQEEAITGVVKALKRSSTILKNKNKPIGSFLFLGPTGVGKTQLCKTLSDVYFKNEKSFLRLDMSEFSVPHSTQRLIGSPPGYVGYEEGGQLTNFIHKNPNSLVLFDEIEKANEKIFDIFLQILDEGRLTDSKGELVSFNNTIIIFTSNIGSQIIYQNASDQNSLIHTNIKEFYEKKILPELLTTFTPEFVNRFEEIILFKPLTKDQLIKITKIKIQDIKESLQEKHIELIIRDDTFNKIIDEGYDPKFGARPLERVITRVILDNIAQLIIDGKVKNGDTIEI